MWPSDNLQWQGWGHIQKGEDGGCWNTARPMVYGVQVSNCNYLMCLILTWCSRAEAKKALDEKRQMKWTLRGSFLHGSNSTYCGHIASHHFDEYEKQCDAAIPKIVMNFWYIPEWARKAKEKGKGKEQTWLGFSKVKGPGEFSREGILEAVAKLIACEDQVSFGVQFNRTC
jgi:hypothetical protein